MRPLAVLLLAVAIFVAGCASPADTKNTGTGPIDLSEKSGLLAIDLTTRQVTLLSLNQGLAWMSPSGAYATWQEKGYAVLLDSTTAPPTRSVVEPATWVRVFDNATGLELTTSGAYWRPLNAIRTDTYNTTLPPTPHPNTRWTGSSADLRVLGAEYVPAGSSAVCENEIYIRANPPGRTTGCHLRIAADGRAGWTEGGGIRVRGLDGEISNITPGGGGDITASTYVSYENPVFTDSGVAYLKLTGGKQLVRTEVIAPDGSTVATLPGPMRMAFHDISDDGRFLLVRAFVRAN